MSEAQVKQQVREFYDRVGWQQVSEGVYQNARYEDLRPVSAEYVRRCHLRINRHLKPQGRYLLDAGSGPIQYPEYLTYSKGYRYRVCVDISIVALQEARARIGAHGLCVVADVASLPFRPDVFDGQVSLHTFHHLPLAEQQKAYLELLRTLAPGSTAVVVNGWTDSPLMRRALPLVRLANRITGRLQRSKAEQPASDRAAAKSATVTKQPTGTFIEKLDAAWLKRLLGGRALYEIRVWRSVSVGFLRALIHPRWAGRLWLRLLFALEERFPHYFGERGQYPLIVIRRP